MSNKKIDYSEYIGEEMDLSIDPETREQIFDADEDAAALIDMVSSSTTNTTVVLDVEAEDAELSNELAETSAEDMNVVLGGIKVVMPDTLEEMMQMAIDERNRVALHGVRCGYLLLEIKNRCAHGEFGKYLSKNKWPERDAQNCMAIAKLFVDTPAELQNKLTKMNKSGLIELSRLEPEQIQELAEADQLDEFATMPHKELIQEVRQLRQRNVDLDNKVQDLTHKQVHQYDDAKFAEVVLKFREEANYANAGAGYHADSLNRLMDLIGTTEFVDGLTDGQEKSEAKVATHTLYLCIVEAYKKFRQLIVEFEERGFDKPSMEKIEEIESLSGAELTNIEHLFELMQNKETLARDDRHIKRGQKKQAGKRGRPRGTTKN